jgi:hypothetical protein
VRRSSDIARIDVTVIRSGGPDGRFGLADGSPVMPCCICDFDALQSSLEDSGKLHVHVIVTAALLGKFPGRSTAPVLSCRVTFHCTYSTSVPRYTPLV